jgi:exopolysaccharide production protein ExoQ
MTATEQRAAFLLGAATLFLVCTLLLFDPTALSAAFALPAILVTGLVVWSALRGEPFGTMALLFIAVFLIDAVFRRRDPMDKSLDYQVIMKVSVWFLMVIVSAVNIRSWYRILLMPSNMPWIFFLSWLCLSAMVSRWPMYSALTSFSIYAHAVFCAYVFTRYQRVDIFAVIVASITVFCVVSFVIYFAIPEYGRFIYWLNGERYLSGRMAGITGSANNLGRLAAFGLVLLGIYASEFRRYHRLFAPVAGIIMGIVLVMTNSRSSMAMVLIILLAIYALNWRRFYLIVLMLSVGCIGLAILLPFTDQVLSLISRSGSVEEVSSLTGRTSIWNAVLMLSAEKPWTGYGYASSIFLLPENENIVGFSVGHAHNLFLQLLLTTGWIGVILFAAAFFSIGLRAAYSRDWVVVALLAVVVLNGITEASGFTTLANICSLAFCMAITLPPQRFESHEDDPAYQR